ncbi:MAG: hypothetical protein ACLUD2_04205 [Clostridium sp.]
MMCAVRSVDDTILLWIN